MGIVVLSFEYISLQLAQQVVRKALLDEFRNFGRRRRGRGAQP